MNDNSRLVYSTQTGRICPTCGLPAAACSCKKRKKQNQPAPYPVQSKHDGIVRIQKEVKGRGGKCVSVIYGLEMDDTRLKQIAKQLKSICGTGGAVKDGTIIIQGDHRQKLQAELQQQGIVAKLAGG
ncbi:MAG: stress response translation initiation inhibitor YciH [Desulfobacterales bacterium]|jgi:translation initiation factor 1|nr:stress response translation initiation inhibitor YciH [Desulfobacterales bacterium]